MEEMSFLSFTRSLNSTLPIRQHPLQRPFGMLQGRNVLSNPNELLLCQFKDPLTRSTTSVASFQNLREFGQRESDVKCPLNDVNSFDGTSGINPVARSTPHCLRQHADFFIMPNRVRTDSRRFRQFARVKRRIASLHHDEYQPLNAFQCQELLFDHDLGLSNRDDANH
jgi:hypothetical protein